MPATHECCNDCGYDIPLEWTRCPHCGRPGLFPNVRAANQPHETEELENRYLRALQSANQRGCESVVADFEEAAGSTRAVINRPIGEVQSLATSETELYATFYQLRTQRLPRGPSVPDGPDWDRIRAVADTALFGDENKTEIRFAALSLEETGLNNYGECCLHLRESMIAHRASTFEENSILFMKRRGVTLWESANIPPGYRSTWTNRSKLCVAKLADKIGSASTAADFPQILMRQGKTSAEDDFVEVHVFGPMTIRTIEKVVVTRKGRRPSKAVLRALEVRLNKLNVKIEVQT